MFPFPFIDLNSLSQNTFFQTGAGLMLLGSVIALFRRAPVHILEWAQRRATVTVDVHSSNQAFDWVAFWLASQPYARRARKLTAVGRYFENSNIPQLIFSPAPGTHLFWYKRRLVWLERSRKEAKDDQPILFAIPSETFHLRIVGRSQTIAREILETARDAYLAAQQTGVTIRAYISCGQHWSVASELTPRPFDSLILPEGQAEEIHAVLQEFLSSAEWYRHRGIPYRLGFLFYGIPGTGKTSTIMALASILRLNIYVVNLGGDMTDAKLNSLIADTRSESIVVFEDIDCITQGRNLAGGENGGGVSFSALLNVINGIASREGAVVCMTTNHKDRLDPALIRAGRADHRYEFTYATPEQAERLYRRFFPEHTDWAIPFGEMCRDRQVTMADLQGHLLHHRHTPERAVSELSSSFPQLPMSTDVTATAPTSAHSLAATAS